MKVLHVMAGAEHGGAETMFADSVKALHQAGITQELVCRPSPLRDPWWQERSIPVHHARFPAPWCGWRTAAVLRGAVARFKPDVVHYWMARAASYARKGPVPNIGWFGGYYDLKYYRNCQYFVGVTRDLARYIAEAGAPAPATACIHTFADLSPAPPVSRAEFTTPEDAPLLLSLARLHHHKALDVLLKALVQVPEAWVWLAGEGPLRAELQALAEILGVAPRVRFLGWRSDRAALLAACDLCVFPSRIEPFGTVTVEAWACNKPLVAARAAGPAAYIDDGKTGLLVDIDDADGLAAAIRRALGDADLRASLVEAGRLAYEKDFTREVLVRELTGFYRRAITESGGTAA